jgi:hypothetical protein
MARPRTGDTDDPSALGTAYTRGHNKPIGWRASARCRGGRNWVKALRNGGQPGLWIVDPRQTYVLGDDIFSGEQLIEMAVGLCSLCSVQWDCASYAVAAGEPWGVWAMRHDDLIWLMALPDPERFIRRAERRRVPVQFAVAREQAEQSCALSCPA